MKVLYDQQLYCTVASILWYNRKLAKGQSLKASVFLWFSSISMKKILEKVCVRVPKMLTEKKYPQTFRAFRMLMEEVLRPLLKDRKIISHSEPMNVLEEKIKSSRTKKSSRTTNDINPQTYLSMYYFYVWDLLDLNGKETSNFFWKLLKIRYHFFAAGHVNYKRWGLYYLRNIEALPDDVFSIFMKRKHTIQLSVTPWSGIWLNMGIKVPYIRIGKGTAEIIGQSTNMDTMKVWAYSLNAFCEVVEYLEAMEDGSSSNNMHKEEKKPIILDDQIDWDILRKKLEVSIDIFNNSWHGEKLVNIVIRKDLSVNVVDSIQLGEDETKNFQKHLPGGFYNFINGKVKTMVNGKMVWNQERKSYLIQELDTLI